MIATKFCTIIIIFKLHNEHFIDENIDINHEKIFATNDQIKMKTIE